MRQENKDDAVYGTPPPLGLDARCELCKWFEPVSPSDGAGVSKKTTGIVNPKFGCMNFERRVDTVLTVDTKNPSV